MKHLFSSENVGIISSLTSDRALYAFDFDGTLAPIVQYPKDAAISNMTMGYLKQLNDIVPVAIISGRSLEDLETKFPFRPKYLIGNHGLEGIGPNSTNLVSAQTTCSEWRALIEKELFVVRKLSGIEIEDKVYSIAVHYRRADNKGEAKLAILNAIASLEIPARIVNGKSVINVLPPGASHKGAAVVEIMLKESVNKAFYIGDDDTDEDVFALTQNPIVTIRVGEKSESLAQYFIKTQNDINKLLRLLIDHSREALRHNNLKA